MHIDWAHFTPWASLIGGLLLGIAASLLMLLQGRILGISGILGGLLVPRASDSAWRLAFLLGLAAAPAVYFFIAPPSLRVVPHMTANTPLLLAAGLLVGLGTRYGAGCTSGHGVCGLSRLSLRSLVATLCFMASGFLTVGLARHLL